MIILIQRTNTMLGKVLLLVASVAVMLPGFATSCSCNGYVAGNGQGECRTKYKGKEFCYVQPGQCEDQRKGSSSSRFWSYNACESQAQEQKCYTIRGGQCQFPFRYKGKTFSSCTTFDSENGAAWCTTKKGKYEDCAAPCNSFSKPLSSCSRNPVIQGLSRNCCTEDDPCAEGEGDCDTDNHDTCQSGLICGDSNCGDFSQDNFAKADCCFKQESQGHDYNYKINKDGSIDCQLNKDCPPDFQTADLDSVTYRCGYDHDSDQLNVCMEIVKPAVKCGNGKKAEECILCGNTVKDCGGEDWNGVCYLRNSDHNGPRSPYCDGKQFLARGTRLSYSSSVGGIGSLRAANPDRFSGCRPRTCRRGRRCCRLVSIGYNSRYLGCPSYC